MVNFEGLVEHLIVNSQEYDKWFELSTQVEQEKFYKELWHNASKFSENQFLQGVYEFYQLRNTITYRQFVHVVRVVFPHLIPLKQLSSLKETKWTTQNIRFTWGIIT